MIEGSTPLAEIALYAGLLAGGALLGLFFYGGLWWTVQRLPASKRPALLTVGSFGVRTAVALSGFYVLMDGRLLRLAAAMVGFLAVRAYLVQRIRPQDTATQSGPEGRPAVSGSKSLEKERQYADQS